MNGKVKFYNEKKGFGFIAAEDGKAVNVSLGSGEEAAPVADEEAPVEEENDQEE